MLWSGGISFGGVISFIYADLIIIPLILIAEQASLSFGLRFRRPIALIAFDSFARQCGRSGWIRRQFHQRLKLAVVHLASAELRNLLHHFYLVRDT